MAQEMKITNSYIHTLQDLDNYVIKKCVYTCMVNIKDLFILLTFTVLIVILFFVLP